jgi:hypothetical protein
MPSVEWMDWIPEGYHEISPSMLTSQGQASVFLPINRHICTIQYLVNDDIFGWEIQFPRGTLIHASNCRCGII